MIQKGGADNSFVHHIMTNTSQQSCTKVLLAALILGRREKGKEALVLKPRREVFSLHNEFSPSRQPSPAAFTEGGGMRQRSVSPESNKRASLAPRNAAPPSEA